MEEVLLKLKKESVAELSKLMRHSLAEASIEIAKKRGTQSGTVNIYPEIDKLVSQFADYLAYDFDKLIKPPEKNRSQLAPADLSLVSEDFYESENALDGMIAFARYANLQQYISLTTRLNSIFFKNHIDEANNPLDPEKIGQAFVDALRSLKMNNKDSLTIYRKFNQHVFHKLGKVLTLSNQILIDKNVKPDLVVETDEQDRNSKRRSRHRSDSDPSGRAFSENPDAKSRSDKDGAPELFAVMQALTHGLPPGQKHPAYLSEGQPVASMSQDLAVPVAAIAGDKLADGLLTDNGLMIVSVPENRMLGSNKVEILSRDQLLEILSTLQKIEEGQSGSVVDDLAACKLLKTQISEAIELASSEGSVNALDIPTYDILNVINMLYEEIARDVSLIGPVKKLICSTQITIVKMALVDECFFSEQDHPARTFMNNVANAGIGWVDIDKLKQDSTFVMIEKLINRFVNEYSSGTELVEGLLKEFEQFKAQQSGLNTAGEATEDHAEKVNTYVSKKIKERISEPLHPIVSEILLVHFHKFMTELVVREGVGGNSWKHVVGTIDELLWSVRAEKQPSDQERLDKINPKILSNLKKAFKIAGVTTTKSEELITQLQAIQISSFSSTEAKENATELEVVDGANELNSDIRIDFGDETEPDSKVAIEADEHLLQINKLPLGGWVEFIIDEDHKTPCMLAAKLETVDKFVFVNRQGLKMAEKSRMKLAEELKSGKMKIICEWPLFERAMESVIGNLRENQFA